MLKFLYMLIKVTLTKRRVHIANSRAKCGGLIDIVCKMGDVANFRKKQWQFITVREEGIN